MALAEGSVLAGCRIEAVVGRGGMGVVYLARQLDLDRHVAVKLIAPELVADAPTRDRFLAEARAAAAVEHPNVLPVHGAGVADGRAYIVMRYVHGDDVRTLIRRVGALDPARAAAIALRIGDALDAIHLAGYVHRDVKPANVLLDDDGHVYLSDFGLAKHVLAGAGPTRSDQWVGTLDYAAPEQLRGERVDARTDVYALGAVLFHMLTGHVPFARESDPAKLFAHLASAPPRPSAQRPELPAALDDVVGRALAKDPAERQRSAGDLGRAARAAVGGGERGRERSVARGAAAPSADASTVTSARPRTRSRRGWVLGAAALAVLAAAAVAGALLLDDGKPAPTSRVAVQRPASAHPAVGLTIAHVGWRPRGVAVAAGSVWIISATRARMTRLDARTGRRSGVQPRIGLEPWNIAADGDAVWVAIPRQAAVVGVDARTGRIARRVRVPVDPVMLAAGPSGLWVVGRRPGRQPDAVLRYDRGGRRLLARLEIPQKVHAIAVGGGAAWVALAVDARILRVSPAGRITGSASTTAPASALAYGSGSVCAAVPADEAVACSPTGALNFVTSKLAARPAQLTIAGGRAWVASNTDHTVVVVDPKDVRRVGSPLPVPLNPFAIASGAGHVWVTGVGRNTVTRLDP